MAAGLVAALNAVTGLAGNLVASNLDRSRDAEEAARETLTNGHLARAVGDALAAVLLERAALPSVDRATGTSECRCGVADIFTFALDGRRWTSFDLSDAILESSFIIPPQEVLTALRQAFDIWSQQTKRLKWNITSAIAMSSRHVVYSVNGNRSPK